MKTHVLSGLLLLSFGLFALGSTGSSSPSVKSSSSLGAPVASVTADEILSIYQANEINADQRFKDKVISVSGVVDTVGKDVLDNMYVAIRGSNEYSIFRVQAFFDDSYASRLAGLSKGLTLTVTCRCEGKFVNVLLKDCRY